MSLSKIYFSLLCMLGSAVAMENYTGDITRRKGDTNTLRVASFNISADFFDKKEPEFQYHKWSHRRSAVLQTINEINPDILGVQELSPIQALELSQISGYTSFFLSQTPSNIEVGIIVEGAEVKEWIGKNIGTPTVGILYKTEKFKLEDKGRFWLKEDPDALPIHRDRSQTDKGFGNMNTYRGPLWVHLIHLPTKKSVYIYNSHYPLSGNHDTRLNCARIERQKIEEISQNNFWVSMGDRNIIPVTDESTESDIHALAPLLEDAYNAVNPKGCHGGPAATFVGFNYDTYKNPIEEGCLKQPKVLDVIVSNKPSLRSQHVLTQFSPETGEVELNPASLTENRTFASDHLMVVADYAPFEE
ncbi:endonuclease/exonuclease/phosphatase [Candidatus Odyssella thessalonicensis]|uniref:endonuclease/exonuclease/phosphatase n=1 Tax=Candidatus Odyssella thessalonicensis TaxID=84647 RepID=UPI000225ACF1|nr:endonuclease/exonuclease/phosphatase [Candidatus Odyssella thessalonicensis]